MWIPVAIMSPTHCSLATELTATADGDGHKDSQDDSRGYSTNYRPLGVAHLRDDNCLVLATRLICTPGIWTVDVAVVRVLLVDADLIGAGK